MNLRFSRLVLPAGWALILLLSASLRAQTLPQGDINTDGIVNQIDVSKLRDHLLGYQLLNTSETLRADGNKDGILDVADVVWLTNHQYWPTITLTLPGGVPLVMVKCPAGSFQMGSPDTERGRGNDSEEGPVHTVILTKPFYLGKYEVTQAQWMAVMKSNPSRFQPPIYSQDLTRPVERVSWDDITEPGGFLEKLNLYLTQTGQGVTMRLPTEAEWEYACRAGTTTRFYFGDSLTAGDYQSDGPTDSAIYPGNRSDYMWWRFNATMPTMPVGMKRANAWGLCDMSGNVREWCQDWYGPYLAGTVVNPTGPATGSERVTRGGAVGSDAEVCRSAERPHTYPKYGIHTIGFRLVLN